MRNIQTESGLEALAVLCAEGNPEVVSLCEQALRICAPVGSRPFFTIDLSLRYRDGREVFYEIKPVSQLRMTDSGRHLPAHWEAIERWFEANGMNCAIMTDVDLEPQRRFASNWRILLPFVRLAAEHPDPELESELEKVIEREGKLAFGSLSDFVSGESQQHVLATAARLLHLGRLSADLGDAPVTPATLVSRRHEP